MFVFVLQFFKILIEMLSSTPTTKYTCTALDNNAEGEGNDNEGNNLDDEFEIGMRSYQVTLPAGPVGVCFETVFNPDGIVVQKMKPKSFAADHTPLSVGDKLLLINDTPIQGLHFDDAMKLLHGFQASRGCTLTLQTVEEQWRLLRRDALSRLGEGEAVSRGGGGSGVELTRI